MPRRVYVCTYGWPLFREPRTFIGHSIRCGWFAVILLVSVVLLPGSVFGFDPTVLRVQAGSENSTMAGMEETLLGEGGIRQTRFLFDQKYEIIVKQGNIEQEKADGVIVPLNTAFAIGGASASVFYAVDQTRRNSRNIPEKPETNIYNFLFPSLNIVNPIDLVPGQVLIDLESRPKVGEKGGVVVSESIRTTGIPLQQGWDRIIVAFIRDQGEADLGEGYIVAAIQNAMAEAEKNRLETVAAVPFGAGFLGIPAQDSASLMVPAVLQYWRDRQPSYPKRITFVMNLENQYYKFAQTTRLSIASFQMGGLEERVQENFLQRQYGTQV